MFPRASGNVFFFFTGFGYEDLRSIVARRLESDNLSFCHEETDFLGREGKREEKKEGERERSNTGLDSLTQPYFKTAMNQLMSLAF